MHASLNKTLIMHIVFIDTHEIDKVFNRYPWPVIILMKIVLRTWRALNSSGLINKCVIVKKKTMINRKIESIDAVICIELQSQFWLHKYLKPEAKIQTAHLATATYAFIF